MKKGRGVKYPDACSECGQTGEIHTRKYCPICKPILENKPLDIPPDFYHYKGNELEQRYEGRNNADAWESIKLIIGGIFVFLFFAFFFWMWSMN